jgi:regulatory protein
VSKQARNITSSEARKKIYHYCAYQERCHSEVKNKLYSLGVSSDEVDEIMTHLIAEGYLSEERFAIAFAGGKFRLKGWGKIKIIQALESKGLTQNCINAGLKEINDDDYLNAIESLLMKKTSQLSEPNLFIKRDRLANYLIQKGFEPELVWPIVKEQVK